MPGMQNKRQGAATDITTDALIVGGGPAGLAVAACLARRGIDHAVLEQGDQVATSWSSYYDRLRLHTVKRLSGLPFRPMPAGYPRYASRDEVVAYLRDYATRFPVRVLTGQEVQRAQPVSGGWEVRGASATYRARVLVSATGIFRNPLRPHLNDMSQFRGRVLHSADYRNAGPFAGQRVLVVGAGNSGAEIAVDLASGGAEVEIAIRSGINAVPLALLGVPIQRWAILVAGLPRPVARAIAPPLLARSKARLRASGIPPAEKGVLGSGEGKIPVIGVALLDATRTGRISVRPGIERFVPDGVRFVDGAARPFEAVVFATGYRPALGYLDGVVALDTRGFALRTGVRSAERSDLFYAGLNYGFAGTLNNIRHEAPLIARGVAAALVRRPARAAVGMSSAVR